MIGPNNNILKKLGFVPFIPGVVTIILLFFNLYDLPVLIYISGAICLVSFVLISIPHINRKSNMSIQQMYDEDHPVNILGGSIYGIVMGLGITEALANFINSISQKINSILIQNPANLLSILMLDLPNTFRLIGFLATIIPFIHGAFLMFTKKWYTKRDKKQDAKNQVDKTEHIGLAFPFFISAFVHAVLFYFIALNVCNLALFISLLWTIMIVNCIWNLIHFGINRKIIQGGPNIPFREWIGLNFNTFAFLSVFVFAAPNLFVETEKVGELICSASQSMSNDVSINIIILLVLFSRSVVDYIVAWKSVYSNSD